VETAGLAVAVALVLGAVSGAFAAADPVVRTPQVCEAALDYHDEALVIMTDLNEAVRQRGDANDPESYAIYDGKVNHLIASFEDVAPEADIAEADCRAGVQ